MKKLLKSLPFIVFLFTSRVVEAVNISNPVPGFFISYNDNSFGGLLMRFIQLLLSIVGIVAMLFIIIGGFQYVMSRGDEELASAGKKTLTNAIIGLVIVILSYLIVVVVINALNGKVK